MRCGQLWMKAGGAALVVVNENIFCSLADTLPKGNTLNSTRLHFCDQAEWHTGKYPQQDTPINNIQSHFIVLVPVVELKMIWNQGSLPIRCESPGHCVVTDHDQNVESSCEATKARNEFRLPHMLSSDNGCVSLHSSWVSPFKSCLEGKGPLLQWMDATVTTFLARLSLHSAAHLETPRGHHWLRQRCENTSEDMWAKRFSTTFQFTKRLPEWLAMFHCFEPFLLHKRLLIIGWPFLSLIKMRIGKSNDARNTPGVRFQRERYRPQSSVSAKHCGDIQLWSACHVHEINWRQGRGPFSCFSSKAFCHPQRIQEMDPDVARSNWLPDFHHMCRFLFLFAWLPKVGVGSSGSDPIQDAPSLQPRSGTSASSKAFLWCSMLNLWASVFACCRFHSSSEKLSAGASAPSMHSWFCWWRQMRFVIRSVSASPDVRECAT